MEDFERIVLLIRERRDLNLLVVDAGDLGIPFAARLDEFDGIRPVSKSARITDRHDLRVVEIERVVIDDLFLAVIGDRD